MTFLNHALSIKLVASQIKSNIVIDYITMMDCNVKKIKIELDDETKYYALIDNQIEDLAIRKGSGIIQVGTNN